MHIDINGLQEWHLTVQQEDYSWPFQPQNSTSSTENRMDFKDVIH